jgi:pimeloyl-ACP methyl ester carboxylesterase
MRVDLVRTTAADGVRLDGALWPPAADAGDTATGIDAFLLIHGTGANFYGSSLLEYLAGRFQSLGSHVLAGNTRGHDIVCTVSAGGAARRQGAAYECVDDGRTDLAAWIRHLTEAGHRRIGLVGHSLGAIKAICAQALDPHPAVVCIVAVSPARLSYSYFLQSPRADVFTQTLALAEEHVRLGKGETLMQVEFPLPYIVTAAGYLDKYGPQERYNVLRYVTRLACPTLVTFGSAEVAGNVAFAGLPEAIELAVGPDSPVAVATIAGADHVYSGTRSELSARIERWLARTVSPRETSS